MRIQSLKRLQLIEMNKVGSRVAKIGYSNTSQRPTSIQILRGKRGEHIVKGLFRNKKLKLGIVDAQVTMPFEIGLFRR